MQRILIVEGEGLSLPGEIGHGQERMKQREEYESQISQVKRESGVMGVGEKVGYKTGVEEVGEMGRNGRKKG